MGNTSHYQHNQDFVIQITKSMVQTIKGLIQYKMIGMGIPTIKTRRSDDRLIFIMGIPYGLYVESGPKLHDWAGLFWCIQVSV